MNQFNHLTKPIKGDEVPLFLRKSYFMIDTCDKNICCWSDDGKSFVVKDPNTFEKEIIPQFFKHSKMASFVRQLNFYGFKKVKYNDTLRIDEKLEAETANYCGFKHEKFQRGREDLLIEIKRTQSKESSTASVSNASGVDHAASTKLGTSEVVELRSELKVLKDRIAKMNTNIDELANMVQNVSLHPTEESSAEKKRPDEQLSFDDVYLDGIQCGQKRKNDITEYENEYDMEMHLMEELSSSTDSTLAISGDLDQDSSQDEDAYCVCRGPYKGFMIGCDSCNDWFHGSCIGITEEDGEKLDKFVCARCSIQESNDTDDMQVDSTEEQFVNDLFHSFDSDISDSEHSSCQAVHEKYSSSVQTAVATPEKIPDRDTICNAPDQKLMCKLTDALASLPKNTQETLVNRIINTITKAQKDSASKSSEQKRPNEIKKPLDHINNESDLPIAAATLSALITQCSAAMKDRTLMKQKSLPVIPMHA
jgi:heat shock transcription factor 2